MIKKKVLITGSCGFLGSNLIRQLFKDNQPYNVVSIDNIKHNHNKNNFYFNKSHQFYLADITDKHILNRIFEIEKPNYVINTIINDSCSLAGSLLLNIAHENNVEKVLALSEKYTYFKVFENCNILKLCNNFGPRQATSFKNQNLVPHLVKSILENKKISIYNPMATSDWLHVSDTCSAILKVLETESSNNIYDISCNYEMSNLELFNMICNIMESEYNLAEFVESSCSTNNSSSKNMVNIKSLGWEPKFKLRKGLEHTINWYINNKWFLDSLNIDE